MIDQRERLDFLLPNKIDAETFSLCTAEQIPIHRGTMGPRFRGDDSNGNPRS
jgi:hypothetical protein